MQTNPQHHLQCSILSLERDTKNYYFIIRGENLYIKGDYKLGLLDEYGQRISIIIELPRKNGAGIVSFTTGWMAKPNGHIQLNTPYGGK